jgi:hypothetical protein
MRRTGVIRFGGMKTAPSPNGKCASYFALVARWLRFLTPVTYFYAPGDAINFSAYFSII